MTMNMSMYSQQSVVRSNKLCAKHVKSRPVCAELEHSYNKAAKHDLKRCAWTDFDSLTFLRMEPGSAVSIISGCGLDDRAIEVRSPAEAK
jgi:hypothetical protein